MTISRRFIVYLCSIFLIAFHCAALEPIPDKLVVLTFDDSVASQYTVVRPLLKKYHFGATFFITEGFGFLTDKTNYMTWEQIKQLHVDGFEIGNHTRDHMAVDKKSLPRLKEQLEAINARCAANGIPKPISFAWPGNTFHAEAFPVLREMGIQFARRGGAPEYPYDGGRGFAFAPSKDHPLIIPAAGDARPKWAMDNFTRAVQQATNGHIAVLQFHGVPDLDHPWVHTDPELFAKCMAYLHDGNYKVIALRELSRYVDPTVWPVSHTAIIEQRQASVTAQAK